MIIFKALCDLPSLPPVISLTSSPTILPLFYSTPAALSGMLPLQQRYFWLELFPQRYGMVKSLTLDYKLFRPQGSLSLLFINIFQ